MQISDFKVNQVWKPKTWYAGGYVVTAIGRKCLSLKIDGDPEADDDIVLFDDEVDEFVKNTTLQPHAPSFPVQS